MNLEDIKNNNNFSFVETVADIATNKKFIDGYNDLINGVNNENSYIWNALSAIGQDITSTIYDNVLNYINNVSNIDTCKVKALKSLCKILGIKNYGILQNIENIPIEVIQLIDIFSINKKYLETNDFFKNTIYDELIISSLVKDDKILFQARNNISSVFSIENPENTIKVYPGFNNEVYESFIENMFFNTLSSNLFATYDNKKYSKDDPYFKENPSNLIFKNLESYIAQLNTGEITKTNQDLNLPYRENVESIRSNLNVSLSFNPYLIADKIDAGEDFISNYTGNERYLILLVLDFRKKQKFKRINLSGTYVTNEPLTQYSFYKEKKFIEYLKFVNLYNNILFSSNERFLDNFETYSLDNNFAEIKDGGLKLEELQNELATDSFNITRSVAKSLKDICFNIINIRERLKTQCQKNYMRGTFLLISYIINEYLKNTVKFQYLNENLAENIDRMTRDDIGIQEYDDTTEYFNIKSDATDNSKNSVYANSQFWKNEENSSITGMGLTLDTINNFYLQTMNLKTSVSDVREFLDTIFELGADKTYVNKSDEIIITEKIDNVKNFDSNDNRVEERFNDISAYQEYMFLKYHGTEIGWNPYFNWKNETHSSYQVHPFLYNFIEHNNSYIETIKNAFFNDVNENLVNILVSNGISSHIGDVGNILNIWKDDIIEYSGYRSRYETNIQQSDGDFVSLAEYYDGVFYPDAVKEFLLSATNSSPLKFDELIYCVKNRISKFDILNGLSSNNSIILNAINEKNYFAQYISYYDEYVLKLKELEKVSKETSLESKDIYKKLSAEIDIFLKNIPQTFFEKWYHFANLMTADAEKIATNLSVFKDDIINVISGNYDIYKYTIDKFGNSILLYKQYNDKDLSYNDKLNVPGTIWIRKFGEPIGFPLKQNYTSSNIKIDHSFFNDDVLSSCEFYDFEQTIDYKYLLLVSKNSNDSSTIDDAKVIVVKPEMNSVKDTNHKGEFSNIYSWLDYNTNLNSSIIYPENDPSTNIKFSGIFQKGSVDLVVVYTDCMFDSNIIKLYEYSFPEDYLAKLHLYNISYETNISAVKDSSYKVSYLNGKYAIVWLASIEKDDFYGSNYIGFNSNIDNSQTSEISFIQDSYGEFYDISAASNSDDDEYNSFDIFSTYIAFLEYDTLINFTNLKYYNLNSDASYIPLYPGINGFIKVWTCEYYKKQSINSFELLGKSFNKLPDLETKFMGNIYTDPDGNFTTDNPDEFARTISRVFEDYNISGLFKTYYNSVIKINDDKKYSWNIQLLDSINNNNLSTYECYLYNIKSGATLPVFSGKLNDITMTYVSAMTNGDKYFLNNNIADISLAEVFGTPNIFSYKTSENNEKIYTASNSIFNVTDVSVEYVLSSNTLKIEMDPLSADSDYIIEQNSLILILNKARLDEYSSYHYMTHHDSWPYKNFNSEQLLSIELSNYTSFDNSEISDYFETGNVVFKINEEDNSNSLSYPYSVFSDAINDIFSINSSTNVKLENIFSNDNTFVLELASPKEIADIVGTIEMGVYSSTTTRIRVSENYLSAMHSISKYSLEFLSSYAFGCNTEDDKQAIRIADKSNKIIIDNIIKYTVTEADIKDFLKLYVNYTKEDDNGITLFFNYNNLFASPYLYRRDNGKFFTVFKLNTFKKLKPGESDIIDIVIQVKYTDFSGEIRAIKDIPVLSYKIYNVSDDKPKFIIKNSWTIFSGTSNIIKSFSDFNNTITLDINKKTINNIKLLDNFTTEDNNTVFLDVNLISDTNTNIKNATCDIIYEFSDPYLKFIENKSSGASFYNKNGLIHVSTTNKTFTLAFEIKAGCYIDEKSKTRTFPITAINFKAIDENGNSIKKTSIIDGNIIINAKSNDSIIKYLGIESDSQAYYITIKDNNLIRIYRNTSETKSSEQLENLIYKKIFYNKK